jgi:large subunit ribosomal protein L19
MSVIKLIEQEYMKKEGMPDFVPGDTLRIHVKVVEGERERIQVFEGIVIGMRGTSISKTFTARRISHGVGVERTFLINSPRIDKIEVKRKGDVRRAKLYYLRGKVGKAATKVKEKHVVQSS